ncbi:ArsR/SmtB family transcription factor [Aeromicrobium ginsengisoli]|uniref:Helix-turn-helix transcriptional regulator n=1 Tax=Aeromicrobium ginsengisoli TaxID=363867 RepID=A0A5M4FDT3_9ACTN|nr:helix-turn-helix domain-containing protein [Aeromicrobium ginsengisoli]KAA1396102.1 helix-turn-helix transcriptional regulator [Aeromicrobium ginsengisoli]
MNHADTPQPGIRRVTEAAVLSAMAHPFRARLIDALKVDGPSTASALSQRTGQAVGSVSHHLKVLAEVKLVEEVPELARDRRERWWRLVDAGWKWTTSDFADDPVAATVAAAAESAHFNRQVARTHEWLDNHDEAGEWVDAAFATQNWLHLTPTELSELSVEIVALLQRWHDRPTDDGVERQPVLVYSRGFPSQP